MSQDIRGLWSPSSDPQTRFLTAMANKLTKFLTQNQVEAVQNDNEDIYSNCVDVESSIKFHTFNGQHLFPFNKIYYPTFEPDHDKVKVWIRARNTGNTVRDLSGYNNTAYLYGDPIMVDGKQDVGTNTHGIKSLAIRLNRTTSPYENLEYLSIPDSTNTQIDDLTTGFSEFMRFKIYALDSQGSLSRTLWCKIDDSTPLNGRVMKVQNDGRLIYIVLDAGVLYAKQTAQDVILPNTLEDIDPYDVFTSYNASTHAIKIYLDGQDMTLTNFTGGFGYPDNRTLHDMNIFRRGYLTTSGYLYGDFMDYRLYAEKIVSQTEVSQMFANKWTISNIAFGACAVVDHLATYAGSGGSGSPSFDPISFDPSSFST